MKWRWLLPLLLLVFVAASKKESAITIRFHSEANPKDGESFVTAVKLMYPPRDAYIDKMPEVTERDVVAIWPFAAPDGTMGCAFKLDDSGRLRLSTVSTEKRGTSLVGFVNNRQLAELVIDRPVNDGVITIPRGITAEEIALMVKRWPVLGQPDKKKHWF